MFIRPLQNFIHRCFLIVVIMFLMISCCNEEDRHHWYPEEAVRYYNENDTITFYSVETGQFEVYPICDREPMSASWEHKGTWCYYVETFHGIRYSLQKDSCASDLGIVVSIKSENNIAINWDYSEGRDYFDLNPLESHSAPINVLGSIYENTFEIPNGKYGSDSIKSVIFSFEYGIIQYNFNNATYSLVNKSI